MQLQAEGGSERNIHHDAVAKTQRVMPETAVFQGTAEFFKAMADPTRVKIIWALDQTEMCVCDLAEMLGMTMSAISHQLATLRRAKLVRNRREGKEVFYSLADDHVHMMLEAGIEHTLE